MPLSRASTQSSRASIYSQASQPLSEHDVPGDFLDTEAARAVSTQQSLSEAIHARRAEFTRPNTIRIKVGTWNVAGKKGTESDIGAWFVKSKGVSEALTGLENTHLSQPHSGIHTNLPTEERRENVDEQEARVAREPKKSQTVPKHDHGEVPGRREVGLYVLGLQEIVDITSPKEAIWSDPTTARRWREKLQEVLPSGYQSVAEQQLVGLMMFIFASPTVASQITGVSTTTCGTGIGGFAGNKGAVTTRIVLGETTRLVFVNSHLSSGLGKAELERRNWDAAQIVNRTQYTPIEDSLGYVSPRKERIGDEDFSFWFGDLNYRLEGIPGDDVRRLLMLHTRNEYDLSQQKATKIEQELAASTDLVKARQSQESQRAASTAAAASSTVTSPSKTSFNGSSTTLASDSNASEGTVNGDEGEDSLEPSSDPAHLQTTLDSLLPHDELHQMQTQRKMFQDGWREGPITFLPTYKYDVGSVGVFDSGDKKRGPSWCDRILYRTRKDRIDYENMLLEEQESQRKDKEFEANGMDKAASEESTLYDYDPEADAEDAAQDDFATGDEAIESDTQDGFRDLIQLEYYVSHQRVLSSDHKPLGAVFRLEYDAVVPELKSKVHQEVARDLDRAENEARPVVTLIPDSEANGDGKGTDAVFFGDIRYGESKAQTLTLANTGRAMAVFGFLARQQIDSGKMSPSPEWLSISIDTPSGDPERSAVKQEKGKVVEDWATDVPDVYSLEPGCTCTIRLTACVKTKTLVKRLNDGGVLDDVLILRVKEGRDHFVPIHGTWLPTVFNRSIGELIRLPEGGVRKVQIHPSNLGEGSKRESAVVSSAPKELFRLTQAIEALSERILAEWGMLQDISGSTEEAPWIKHAGWPFDGWTLEETKRSRLRLDMAEALDTGKTFDEVVPVDEPPIYRLEALCETLLLFLDGLIDGVIDGELWTQIVFKYFGSPRSRMTVSRDDQRAAVLEILSSSSPHSVSFVLLTSMLGQLAQEVANNVQEGKIEEMPSSPNLHIRRKTLSTHPIVARKQLVQKSYAALFADPLIRLPEDTTAKARAASLDQRRELIEMFLDHGSDQG